MKNVILIAFAIMLSASLDAQTTWTGNIESSEEYTCYIKEHSSTGIVKWIKWNAWSNYGNYKLTIEQGDSIEAIFVQFPSRDETQIIFYPVKEKKVTADIRLNGKSYVFK